jgi:hypothetical protein
MEFIKKWTKIDFLRLDKYIMLTQTIVKKFFENNMLSQNYENVLNIFKLIEITIKTGLYNFSFISVIMKLVAHFVDDLFKTDSDIDIKKKFLEGYFLDFFEKLISVSKIPITSFILKDHIYSK